MEIQPAELVHPDNTVTPITDVKTKAVDLGSNIVKFNILVNSITGLTDERKQSFYNRIVDDIKLAGEKDIYLSGVIHNLHKKINVLEKRDPESADILRNEIPLLAVTIFFDPLSMIGSREDVRKTIAAINQNELDQHERDKEKTA